MKATLFTCALAALASSALARPQQGYNSQPTYGSQSGSGTGSNKPNGAGSGTGPQPSSISSPIGGSQNGNKPQGSGNNGNGPSSIIPGQSVSSPVAGTQPQGSQPQGVNGGSGNGGVVPGQSVSSPVAGSQQTPQSGAGPLAPGSTLGGLLPGSNGGVQLSGQNGNGQQGGVSGAVPGQNGGISGAVPGQNGGVGSGISGGQCVSHQEAYQFIQLFQSILAKQNSPLGTPEQTANYLLADNFTETSNSILSLEGLSLNGDGLSAHSKQEWIEGVVNHAPPYGEIQDIKILVDCNEVLWYYNFGKIGSGQYPIKGYDLFTLTRTGSYQGQSSQSGQQGSPLQVEALYVEFDSIAWGLDTNEVVCTRPDESGSAAGGQQSASASSSGSQS